MISETLLFVGLAFVVFLFAGVLSPFEALGWWAGWYGDEEEPEPGTVVAPVSANHFVIFLSGINSVSGEAFAEREVAFLTRLKRELADTDALLIDDIFPYSVTERPLTGRRVFSRFWRWALRTKLSGPGLAGFLINLRNLWQVAVSADSRYGPIYNQGSAKMLLSGLRRHGYRPGSGVPVTLIGYSGGGQVAVGAAPHLKTMIHAPISVISLGGVISADPALLTLEHVYHLCGARDSVQRLGSIFFPGRWPFIPSPWNTAKKRGVIELIPMGPTDHTGPGGYLDEESRLPDGRSYLDQTVATITCLIRKETRRAVRVYPAAASQESG
jgi:hypothetical protein